MCDRALLYLRVGIISTTHLKLHLFSFMTVGPRFWLSAPTFVRFDLLARFFSGWGGGVGGAACCHERQLIATSPDAPFDDDDDDKSVAANKHSLLSPLHSGGPQEEQMSFDPLILLWLSSLPPAPL